MLGNTFLLQADRVNQDPPLVARLRHVASEIGRHVKRDYGRTWASHV